MPSGRKTQPVTKTIVDSYGHPIREVTFDPLVWPYCVDYKFRDEAHAERHQECMSVAMDSSYWYRVLADEERIDDSHELMGMVYSVFNDLHVNRLMDSYDDAYAIYLNDLMEHCMGTFTWDQWSVATNNSETLQRLRVELRNEDARWDRLKVSLFDLVEEGFLFEAEQILRESMHWGVGPTMKIFYPSWSKECMYSNYWVSFLNKKALASVDEWGIEEQS